MSEPNKREHPHVLISPGDTGAADHGTPEPNLLPWRQRGAAGDGRPNSDPPPAAGAVVAIAISIGDITNNTAAIGHDVHAKPGLAPALPEAEG